MAKNKEKKADKAQKEAAPKKVKTKEQFVPTRVGIEVDGTEVHIAFVEPTGVVRVEHFRDANSHKALDFALKAIPPRSEIIRVAFTGGRQYVRRLKVPHVPDKAMRAAMMAIAEENLPIVPGAASIAGLIVSPKDYELEGENGEGRVNSVDMVIAAVESDDLDPVWRKLGGRLAPITSASFLLPADGLYLRVARAASEMIVLKNGVPLLARTLRVGGLDDLERRINTSGEAAEQPSFDGSNINPDAGKSAAEITDFYLEELISEFRKTLVFWKREGAEVPTDIIVLGAGATIPTLLTRVRDSGFNILSVPEPRGVNLLVQDHEKPVAFQALVAAYSDFSKQPYAILPNPIYETQKAADVKKAKHRAMTLLAAAAIVSLLFLSLAPLAYAKTRETLASRDRKEADKNIEKLRPLIEANKKLLEGEEAVKFFETGVPAYSKIVCSVLSSVPTNVPAEFVSLSISSTESGASIDSTVQVFDASPGFQVIGDWQVRLEKTISSKSIGTGAFKFNPESGTKDGSFKWSVPLKTSFLVPNVESCEGYVDGLSEIQLQKISLGYDPNDDTLGFNGKGELINLQTKEKVESRVSTTTTTTTTPTTTTTIPESTTTTTSTSSPEGDE